MRIASSVEYATRVMLRLARLEPSITLSGEKISESENIPRDYMDQILAKLRRSSLVQSRRGAQGGYCLAKPPSAITLGMIVRAVDDTVFEAVCDRYAEGEQACTHTRGCGIRPVWQKLGLLVEGYLDKVTLEHLQGEEPCVGSRVDLLFSRPPALRR